MTKDRLMLSWYEKRATANKTIKKFLIDHIKKYSKEEYDLTAKVDNLNYLNYEDLLELAIAVTNKNIKITLGAGKDFDNGWDAKMYSVRTHSSGKAYSAAPHCASKEKLAMCVFEPIQENFFFFAINDLDNKKYVSIPFELNGDPKRENKWWSYEKESLSHMVSAFNQT